MVRSLYSGISGLRNHQVSMDVTGNNIANVNTIGFKAGRVTFEESMYQLLQGATRPAGNSGGTNPLQVGLGMSIGSVDTILTQGNLQTTGQITDLALEGNAYFAFSSGEGTYYSRNGGLQLDGMGRLVSPTNGFTLQGMMAAPDGSFPPGSRIGDLRIPYGEKSPAQDTTRVSYSCNLDSDSDGLGTITHTNRFLSNALDTSTLTSLFDSNGNDLGIEVGDTILVSVSGVDEGRITVTEGMTLNDLAGEIQNYLRNDASIDLVAVNVTADGELVIDTTLSAQINGLQIHSSRPGSNSYIANALSFPPSIPDNSNYTVEGLRVPAVETDLLSDVFDANGEPLGLEPGDTITINGSIGGETAEPTSAIFDNPDLTDTSSVRTISDLLNLIQQAYSLPETDGTAYNNPTVTINAANTDDDRIPDGTIVVRGQREEAFSLTGLSILSNNSNNDTPSPARFNANMAFTEIQSARNTGVHSTSIVVYDESGDAHTMTTTFTHSGVPNEWFWEISTEGGEEILSGNRGRITFGQDGSPASMNFDDNSTGFRFDPMNGSNIVSINLEVGTPGSFGGITQFRSPSTTVARYQDGYPMGKLQEISIDETGEISGIYSNGVTKAIARVFVAEFNNPAGLFKTGDSMLASSNNSGEAVMLRPGVGSTTKIKPGALEMSNVELATEFTNMISTQRGFQANARVITTSDSMLQELVQLIR
ncbi:MAG TPA: flagellar hook-basal body complex protein [Chitinispirillaceae bacterium]|nr:flagellar hook-basal body complex protein [Chitinispirillaceae bacterium]